MTNLRLFIHTEDLLSASWQSIEQNDIHDSGEGKVADILQFEFESVEIYLAPTLATIIKVELGSVSDRRINDDFLLSLVEDSLAEEIENCKPILLRLNDGVAYVAIVNRVFHTHLLELLSEQIKKVRFIQPFPYCIPLERDGVWVVYLIGHNKFVRTSQYEYYLLDDQKPIPVVLEQMLQNYEETTITLYTDDETVADELKATYKLNCTLQHDILYGVSNWNFYNEKSKRFNLKLQSETSSSILRLGRYLGYFAIIFVIYWLLNLGFMLIERSRLQSQLGSDLKGITTSTSFSPQLLSQVDDKLTALAHTKGAYAASDMVSLLDIFLRTMPDVNSSMIAGIQYSGSQLTIFLNSQFDPSGFPNDQIILATKRIGADIYDYKTYQAGQNTSNNQTNNGGGALADSSSSSSTTNAAVMQDAAWVINLQIISRMDNLDERKVK
ncbi:MAG: hypothetical protein EKK54_02495 [Neisseriaceae bacterium]|nr:MAG: hypothetical protein EKK54_02495 [Neisseriaceae bacterium]